jgi:hypothetical protein
MADRSNAYVGLAGKLEGLKNRWEENIKMYLRKIGWEDVDRIHLD